MQTSPERIISDSGLPGLLRDRPGTCMNIPGRFARGSGHFLDAGPLFDLLLPRWRSSVCRQAVDLADSTRGRMAGSAAALMRGDLREPLDGRAALVAELFRTRTLVKNAHLLDAALLRDRIREALRSGAPLRFEIAWGQAKCDLAGLKTAGPHADLAEVFGIARLVAVVHAATGLLQRPVRMSVLSGGRRFSDAFLTRVDQLGAYDEQRQAIADALSQPGLVSFHDYVEAQVEQGADRRAWKQRYLHSLSEVSGPAVTAALPSVTLNVDWANVLALAIEGERPHGAVLEPRVVAWLASSPTEHGALLTRAAVTSLLARRRLERCASLLTVAGAGGDVLTHAVSFYSQVAHEAARRYVAIHTTDRQVRAARASADVVRLTVHEKRDQPAMPAVAILGMRQAGRLPQHVAVSLPLSGAPIMGSITELMAHRPAPVPVHVGADGEPRRLFGWLSRTDQPLCFSSAGGHWFVSLSKALETDLS